MVAPWCNKCNWAHWSFFPCVDHNELDEILRWMIDKCDGTPAEQCIPTVSQTNSSEGERRNK